MTVADVASQGIQEEDAIRGRNRGVGSMGSETTLQTVEEIRTRLKNSDVHMPTRPYMKSDWAEAQSIPLAGLPIKL